MSRFRFASLPSVLVALLGFAFPVMMNASTAPPQLLPYTSTVVVGGGPFNSTTNGTTYTSTSHVYAVGDPCATGSTLTATDKYGNGCMGSQLTIVTPRAVATDSQGNVFIIDSYNYEIRRVDAHTGIVTAYAGGGSNGTTTYPFTVGGSCGTGSTLTATDIYGDGCLATQVSLTGPEGMAIDANDNVWFTDFTLSSVREISHATGIITTVVNVSGTIGYNAGNAAFPGVVVPAAQGMLYHPYGIAFDVAGNLYIADDYNNTVEAVNLGTQTATIAGMSIPAGAIASVVGAYGCPTGTTGCNSSSYYGKTNGSGSTAAAKLDSPYQVAVDNSGNIYIADEFPYDVRVLNTSGILSTFANMAQSKSATIVRGPALTTPLANTYGVAVDAAGDVYVAVYESTSSSSYIDRVDIATGIIYPVGGQVVTAAPAQGQPQIAGTGAKYCAGETDAVGDGCPGTQATFYKPYEPSVDAAGNVYIADQGNQLVRKLATGAQFPPAGQATGTAVTQTLQVHFGAADAPGSYTVGAGFNDFTLGAATCTVNTDTTQDCLLPVTFKPSAPGARTAPLVVKSTGGLTSTFALTGVGIGAVLAVDPGARAALASTGVTAVAGVAIDQAGNTYAAVPGATSIVKLTAAGVASNVGTGLTNPTAVAVDAMGNVFAGLAAGSVVEVPANGAAQTTVATGIAKLSGLAADAIGNVYVSDSASNQVSEVNAKTGVQHVIATGSAGVSGPSGLAVDLNGNVYVANAIANNVVELPFVGGASVAVGSGLSAPQGVTTDAAGSVYVADTKNGRLVFIPNESGKLNTADQLTLASGLIAPVSIAAANSGLLTVADSSANAVYTYTRSAGASAFGNVATGTQVTGTGDIVSAGNAPVTFGTPYFTAAGNTSDFTLTPSTLTSGTSFAAGFGYGLTTGFKPTATGNRSAVFTFAATNTAAPTLTLSGIGITPVDPTTTTITVTPGSGTYGQNETITVTVAAGPGLPVPTGMVTIKVDLNSTTQTLTGGSVVYMPTLLGAGTHTVTVSYAGDTNSSPSSATPATFTLAPAPLSVVANSFSKIYGAPLPTFTGTATGAVNGEQVGVNYSSTATQNSPVGTYPITAVLGGAAAVNYTLKLTPGTLTITKAATTTTLVSSTQSVTNGTTATLTATVATTVVGSTAPAPTGMVTFFNGTTAIGTSTLVNGVATLPLSFAATTTIQTNALTAMYLSDANYTASTSSAVAVFSGPVGFLVTGIPTALTVSQGQTALTSFTVAPLFNYAGTISFSCTGLSATLGCVFSPASVTSNGTNTSSLVALAITTVQPGPLARLEAPRTSGLSPIAFAGIPGLMLLAGAMMRRKRLGWAGKGRLLLLSMLLALVGMSVIGCGTRSTLGTAKGPYTVTVVITGTPAAAGGATIVQQSNITLTVQ